MPARKKTITLKVDADLYKATQETFKSRGTDLDTWLQLQLRAFSNSGKCLISLKDKMPSGKYAGASVEDVVRGDTKYMSWVLAQDWAVKYDTDVHMLVQDLASA